VPGADQVRRNLLERTREHYAAFIRDSKPDARLKADAAATYGKLGSLFDQLGEGKEALLAQEQAKALLDELWQSDRGAERTEKLLALAENNLGHSLMKLGRSEEARKHFDQAIRHQQRLKLRAPNDLNLVSDFGGTLLNIGLLEHQMGHGPQAQASYQSAIEQLRRVEKAVSTSESQRKLARAYNNLAATYLPGRPREAARLHGQAIDLLHSAAKTASGDLSLRRDLALTLSNLASALARAGQVPAARASYEQAINLQEALISDAPARSSYKADLAVTLNNLGMLENRLARLELAAEVFGRSIQLQESVLRAAPHNALVESNLAGVYNNLGVARERGGHLQEAVDAFSRAIEHQQAAAQHSPTLPRVQELLALHRENQTRVTKSLTAQETSPEEQDASSVVSLGEKKSHPIEK
jgi:tetratricopeptide (TPR) repeat protein